MFICRPVIGCSRGPYPRFNKAAVYKVKVFGVGVLEEETRRTRWERLPPQTKDRFFFARLFLFQLLDRPFLFFCRVMQKANKEMHVMMKTAQKGLKKVASNPNPNPNHNLKPHPMPKPYTNPLPNQVKRQLAEQEARGRQRQEAALARMEQRHARTVQIEVDRERVQWEAALREEGRSGRQLGNQMKHLVEEQTQLREQWEEATKARNALLKDVGRERRQHDVEKQTWLEKRKNLEAALGLSNKKEDG